MGNLAAGVTSNPEFLPKFSEPRRVLFAAYPEVGLLDLTGPQTVFWAASKAMQKRGLPGYIRETASLQGGLIETAEGLVVHTSTLSGFARKTIDTLVIPGSPHIGEVLDRSKPFIQWISRTSGRARRTASVCSGTFFLAQAGLLENKRAATHWAMCDQLKERFPSVKIDRDAIFVREGAVWTSAGVSAGIDLSLALVEEDCGRGAGNGRLSEAARRPIPIQRIAPVSGQ
jgi:transcriptional regulator GlxA family with amidase domain